MYLLSLSEFLRFSRKILAIFLPGQGDGEQDLFPRAPGGDGSAVGLHDLLGDGQAQPGVSGAGAPGGIQAEKLLEHAEELFRRDCGPGVAEGQDDLV